MVKEQSTDVRDYFTVAQVMQELGIVHKSVYNYAARYQWRDMKVANARLFLKEDVLKTKAALERR